MHEEVRPHPVHFAKIYNLVPIMGGSQSTRQIVVDNQSTVVSVRNIFNVITKLLQLNLD